MSVQKKRDNICSTEENRKECLMGGGKVFWGVDNMFLAALHKSCWKNDELF